MNDIYNPIPRGDAVYFVNSREKDYIDSIEIYIPNNPYERLAPGLEPSSVLPKYGIRSEKHEDNAERALRRAKSAVKDIAYSNYFDWFLTFTFADERDDHERSRQKLSGWLKRAKKQYPDLKYLVVPELHKDGKSLHFHALVSNYQGRIVRAINPKTHRPLTKRRRSVYDLPSYTLGHMEAYEIPNDPIGRRWSSNYLMKYIRKEMPDFKHKKRYWTSRNLDKPLIIENPEEWYLGITPDKIIETEFGKFLYFDRSSLKD